MFCGAFTGRMKPKLATNSRFMDMPTMFIPGVSTCHITLVMIGIIAEARVVALARPRCTRIRNSAGTGQ